MEQVEVEITGMAITQRYGTLTTGDVLRTDADYAKHLVEDCSAAKYRMAPAAQPAEVEVKPAESLTEPEQAADEQAAPAPSRQPRKNK